MIIKRPPEMVQADGSGSGFNTSRRRFLQLAGGIAGAGILLSACHGRSGPTNVYLGSEDTGLLNYLYVLEQVEAAFYSQAVATYYLTIPGLELTLLTDVRDQEIAHREFFKTLLGTNAVPNIVINFNMVTFADRTSVLSHALAIEDLVISAYNGCANLFINTDYTYALAKMVSVEARHSAYFRDMLTYNSFADSTAVGTNGFDKAVTPSMGLATAQQYIQTLFDSSKLPG